MNTEKMEEFIEKANKSLCVIDGLSEQIKNDLPKEMLKHLPAKNRDEFDKLYKRYVIDKR